MKSDFKIGYAVNQGQSGAVLNVAAQSPMKSAKDSTVPRCSCGRKKNSEAYARCAICARRDFACDQWGLTKSQREVLIAITTGKSRKEVSARSYKQVSDICAGISKILKTTNPVCWAHWALFHGYVTNIYGD